MPLALSPRDTLSPVIAKLKSQEVGILTEFDAKRLEAIARLRNDAAHGGAFEYDSMVVESAIKEVEAMLGRLLSAA